VKKEYKRCFRWYIAKYGKSFDTPGIEQRCKYCNGYKRSCKRYIKPERSDISGLVIMNKGN
jgi:hypothetical protein